MILSYAVWSLMFGLWAGSRFWTVRNALRTGAIKTGLSIGRWVYRSTDPREFSRIMRWRVLGGTLWAALALIPLIAIAQVR